MGSSVIVQISIPFENFIDRIFADTEIASDPAIASALGAQWNNLWCEPICQAERAAKRLETVPTYIAGGWDDDYGDYEPVLLSNAGLTHIISLTTVYEAE